MDNNDYLHDIDMSSLEAEVPISTYPCNNSNNTLLQDLSVFRTKKRDVKDATAEPGISGLYNLGNTCFMNSGMQCLLSNPCIVKYFLEEFIAEDDNNKHSLTGKFANLLRKFWSGCFSLLHPSDFKEMVGIYHPQFQDYRQHDCQEFLALLLDSLHEHLNVGCSTVNVKSNSSTTDNEDLGGSDGAISMKDCLKGLESHYDQSDLKSNELYLPFSQGQSDSFSFADEGRKQSLMTLDCMNQLYSISEDSNVSERSTDSDVNCQLQRWRRIKQMEHSRAEEEPSPAVLVAAAAGSNGGEMMSSSLHSGPFGDVGSCISLAVKCISNAEEDELNEERRLLSIEDFCMKDTKTLNTNVLATEYMNEIVSTDSKKFHKMDNNNKSSVAMEMEEELSTYEHLNDLLTCDDDVDVEKECKPVKETNFLINCKEKFSDDGFYGKKLLFSDLECTDDYNINNRKRIKVDEAEKNMKMQIKLKVNTEQNEIKNTNNSSFSLEDDTFAAGPSMVTSIDSRSHGTSGGGVAMQGLNNEDHLWGKYVRNAEKAWIKYTRQNKSVIVDTFQGQFKSTVICLECHHISVTFEPFMYLSVPLPHALERQISIVFVPCDNKQPIRYLITLTKQDNVKKLREELMLLIKEESCDIILAEVFDNHIARVLEDNMSIKFLNDSERMIYALEMRPLTSLDDQIQNEEMSVVDDSTSKADDDDDDDVISTPSTIARDKMMSSVRRRCNSPDDNDDNVMDHLDVNAAERKKKKKEKEESLRKDDNPLNNSYEMTSGITSSEARLESNPDVNWQHNLLQVTNLLFDDVVEKDEENPLGTSIWKMNRGVVSGVVWGEGEKGRRMDEGLSAKSLGIDSGFEKEIASSKLSEERVTAADVDSGEDQGSSAYNDSASNQWKSCAICLEEIVDSDLVIHPICGGTLCHPCLEMSFKHYGPVSFTCPVCSANVNPNDDFVKLNGVDNYKPKTRILSVPVMYRYDRRDDKDQQVMKLFGHPNILYLPSKLNSEFLYETVDRVVPCISSTNYSIILTDGQGYRCSRCLYTQHCSGCELKRDEGQLSFQPSDHLAVKFTDLSESQMESAKRFIDHESMEKLRPPSPLTLFDCFQAFTDSELLDEHNPWFCPKCHKNQCAKKTMTVWRYPDTLVVYLKRFVYHDLSSTKIDNKVVFPVENLDLTNYTSSPLTDSLIYNLQSCVCHFGGANCGHYTAYAKHPIKSEWYYFNDETIIKQSPQETDYCQAYILFYQRQGQPVEFMLPEKCNFDDDLEMTSPIKIAPQMSPGDAAVDDGKTETAEEDDYESTAAASAASHTYDFYN